MTVTPIGYLFISSVLFGILLMKGVSTRWVKNGKAVGVMVKLYFGTILVSISTLFIMGTAFGVKSVYDMVSAPKYRATIISVHSEWQEFTRTNSDGDSYSENVLMQRPKLQFKDNNGLLITEMGNVRSGVKSKIGNKVLVAYKPGNLQVISASSIGLLLGLTVIVLILGYILAEVVSFVLGRKSKWVDRLGILTFAVVIYGGMLSILAGMIYGVFKYFQPDSDMPLWALLLCLFFSIVLALALIGIIRGAKQKS